MRRRKKYRGGRKGPTRKIPAGETDIWRERMADGSSLPEVALETQNSGIRGSSSDVKTGDRCLSGLSLNRIHRSQWFESLTFELSL